MSIPPEIIDWKDIVPGVLLLVLPDYSPIILAMPDPRHLGKYRYQSVSSGSFLLVVDINQNIVPEFLRQDTLNRYFKVLNVQTKEFGYFPREDIPRLKVIFPEKK